MGKAVRHMKSCWEKLEAASITRKPSDRQTPELLTGCASTDWILEMHWHSCPGRQWDPQPTGGVKNCGHVIIGHGGMGLEI